MGLRDETQSSEAAAHIWEMKSLKAHGEEQISTLAGKWRERRLGKKEGQLQPLTKSKSI